MNILVIRRLACPQPILMETLHTVISPKKLRNRQPAAFICAVAARQHSESSNKCLRWCYKTTSYRSEHYTTQTPLHHGLFLSKEIYSKVLVVRTFASESDTSSRGQSIAPLLDRFQTLENSFRYHGYSTLRIGLIVTMIIGLALYIFQEPIRTNVVEEVTQVASRSLGDELVAYKAEEFSKGLLNAIANDDLTLKLAVSFLQEVLDREETKIAANKLVYTVITNAETQQKLTCLCKDVLVATLNDPKIKNEFIVVMKLVLRSEEVVESVRNLLKHVMMREEVQEMMAQFFKSVLAADVVVEQATLLGKNVTKNVMSDAAIQEQAGSSIWKAIGFSLTPSWFSSSPKTPSSIEPTPVED